MFGLHKHIWVETERFYAEPLKSLETMRNGSEMLFQQLLQGVTTVRFECSKCLAIKTEEVLGKSLR